jgi:anaerobic magnesium-protoporphyrin IX monomethyl ester cyclase
MPHLALPVLTSYLRQRSIEVTALDANLSFFLDHLLTPGTLGRLASDLRRVLQGEKGHRIPPPRMELVERELPRWEGIIPRLSRTLGVLKDEKRFFDPDSVLRAVDDVHGLLLLCSLAQWPGRISFNHYRRGDIKTAEDLLAFSSDPQRNVFLPFFMERLLPELRSLSPALVGISISSIHQFLAAMTLARLVRCELPRTHVVVGGKHLLRIQDKLLGHPFYFQEFFHSAVLHEGETPLLELLRALEAGPSLRKVPNLVFQEDGRIVANPVIPPPPLGTLPPPDFRDVRWGDYLTPRRYAPVRTAEGCYWGRCTFCARYGHQRTDHIPPGAVLDALQALQELHGVRDFSMNDDCMPPEYWEELSAEILRRKMEVSMLIWAKPVSGFNRRRLRLMAKAGVRQIRWGVESAHPRVLGLMRKGTTVATARRVLLDASESGIWNHACFIVGFPTETRHEAAQTLEFIRTHKGAIHSFILYPFVLYRHSFVYNHPEEFGIRDMAVSENPFFDGITYATDRGMTPQEARRLVLEYKEKLMGQGYGRPFWYYLRLREYLHLYLDRYGLTGTLEIPFCRDGLVGLRDGWDE